MAEKIIEFAASKLLEERFIDYAAEVITARALPDARDGLKPVQRRILWSMFDSGFTPDSKYRKCARIVGDVMGKYHPHGDSSIYDAMVRLAQDFSVRYPLVDGHGNFGSVDGDSAAAMRYTEAKLSPVSMQMLMGLDKNAVDFVDNYDQEEKEPEVLPVALPNLLLNGASGIAVGMASEVPTHNASELIDGVCAYLDNPKISLVEMMNYITGPDFPTGGILSPSGLYEAYETGRGPVALRGKVVLEKLPSGTMGVIITEIPYQVNKSRLMGRIASVIKDAELDFVLEMRDESSDQSGMRIVIEIEKTAAAAAFVNMLYQKTDLQINYNFNMVALCGGKPKTLGLLEMIKEFAEHRRSVVTRITEFEIEKAKARLHILDGLLIAINNIDKVIKLIRKSKSSKEAKVALIDAFGFDELQAQAILDLRLHRLTSLEIKTLENEIKDLQKYVKIREDRLSSPKKLDAFIKEELIAQKNNLGEDTRRTIISDFETTKLSVSIDKFILQVVGKNVKKREASFKGNRGVVLKTNTSERVYVVYKDGTLIKYQANAFPSSLPDEPVALFNESDFFKNKEFLIVSSDGLVKKTDTSEIVSAKDTTSVYKIKDNFVAYAGFSDLSDEMVLVSSDYMIIKFNHREIAPTGRVGIGVRGMNLSDGKTIKDVVIITEKNLEDRLEYELDGKLSGFTISDLKLQARGGKGVRIKFK